MREFLKKRVSKVFPGEAGLTLALILVFLALPACTKKSNTQTTNTVGALSSTVPIANNSATQNASVSNNPSIPEQNVVSSSTPATISNISVSNSLGLSVGSPTATNGTAPLITQTMTAHERAEYLKEKGIPIITKANFKEPELVWEKTFSAPISFISTDITDNGNLIIVAGKTMYFLDSKGNIPNKIPVKKDHYEIAKGSMGAVLHDWNEKAKLLTLSYYDEFGNRKWTKKIKLAGLDKIQISDNGATIAVAELNPNWSPEGWRAGDLNVGRILFFDNEGKQIYEYSKFRTIGAGALSGDGRYYAAEVYWQNGFKVYGKLIYFDLANKRILWQRPVPGGVTAIEDFIDGYLSVSGKGLYVAVVDETPTLESKPEQVDVFTKSGKFLARVNAIGKDPTPYIYEITESGLLSCTSKLKGWIDVKKLKATSLTGYPPYFLRIETKIIWVHKKGFADQIGYPVSQKIVSINGQVLFVFNQTKNAGGLSLTNNCNYLIVQNGKNIQFFKLHIVNGAGS